MLGCSIFSRFFFFNDTATTEIYTLSLHDALPISPRTVEHFRTTNLVYTVPFVVYAMFRYQHHVVRKRSEEHTSELQSHLNLVCRLLLEKKKLPKRRKTVRMTTRTCKYRLHTRTQS